MRLGTCIALELAAAGAAIAGVWLAASVGSDLAGAYLHGREAAAATATYTPAVEPTPTVVPLERARLIVAPPVVDTVFGVPDAELLAPVAATPVVKVKLNHGGSSLSLRIDFASGARAAFKPLQIHPQSDPRREIAAFRIDRLLGIGRVPPAKSAAFSVDDVIAAIEPSGRAYAGGRIENEALPRAGKLVGEVSWWIPEIKLLRIGGHGIDEPEGTALWSSYLQAGADLPAELAPLLAQIASVIVFDVVIDNSDRWSGNNTQGSPDGRILYFMDNTLSFSAFTHGHAANLSKLGRIQVFPRALIGKLRALTHAAVAAAVGGEDDLLGPLLTDVEIRAIMSRRDHVLEYIDHLIADLGEDAVLALP
ncbi:MAG TPA: hypothetical protein VLM79_40405 [Kofleriaceae bacterium]|nr:hypothetical protein [Kofleriaceae bacterium]